MTLPEIKARCMMNIKVCDDGTGRCYYSMDGNVRWMDRTRGKGTYRHGQLTVGPTTFRLRSLVLDIAESEMMVWHEIPLSRHLQ